MNDAHEMSLIRTATDGRELWVCPTCERSLVMNWHPEPGNPPIQVLNTGEDTVTHAGGKGGVMVTDFTVEPAPAEVTDTDREWLAKMGFVWDG